jgi:hypothetical protein
VFKRLFWLVAGAGFGFGVSFWVMRAVRRTADRYRPDRLSSEVAGALGSFGDDLRLAVAEGRLAMRQRERDLRAELAARPAPDVRPPEAGG